MDHTEPTEITVEHVERLAEKLTAEQEYARERLMRLIVAEARILSIREPDQFPRAPLEHGDQDGYYDNTWPPDQVDKDFAGPRLFTVSELKTDYIATTSGFFYDARVSTTDGGLYISPDGGLWQCKATGTATYGSFAAYPGWCDVRIELEYEQINPRDVPLDRLHEAESKLRALAFPRATQRESA